MSSAGYLVHAAMMGLDALSDIAEDLPDLILLEIMLRGIGCFEVCKRLKMNEKTPPNLLNQRRLLAAIKLLLGKEVSLSGKQGRFH